MLKNCARRILNRRTAMSVAALILAFAMIAAVPAATYAKTGNGWGRLKNADKFLEKVAKNIKKQDNLRFQDWDDASWAIECIAKMRGLGIINGYEGNEFRPNQAVKQAEALAMMVRAFDLEDEAQDLVKLYGSLYISFDDDDHGYFNSNGKSLPKVPKSANWALGYVLIAVDQGWVRLSEINPQAAASREWIAMVMVRALDHEDEAQAKMKTRLPFKDANAVSGNRIGYVAEAVSMGLFEGYDDGTFKPQRSVSRAEMAAILDRFLENELPTNPFMVSGKVTEVSSNQNRIKIATQSGSSVTLTISNDALILSGNKAASKSNIKVGSQVEVLTNGSGIALLIVIKSGGTTPVPITSEVTGTIVGIATPRALTLDVDDQDANVTVALADKCSIMENGKPVAFSSLDFGDKVRIRIDDGKAVKIDVLQRAAAVTIVTGKVTGIHDTILGKSITVKKTDSNVSYAVTLRSDCQVVYGSHDDLDVDDIQIDDTVTLTIQSAKCVKVKITERATDWGDVGGKIVEINQSGIGTSITLKDGSTKRVIALASDVVVRYGKKTLSADDLELGDVVRVDLLNNKAAEILITARAGDVETISGIVTSLVISTDESKVTVKKADNTSITVELHEDVEVTYGSANLTPDKIAYGDTVTLTIVDDLCTKVKITARLDAWGDLGGHITGISTSETGTSITVEDGLTKTTVNLAADVTVSYGTTTGLTADDLGIGDVVRIDLENHKAVEIRIISRDSTGS